MGRRELGCPSFVSKVLPACVRCTHTQGPPANLYGSHMLPTRSVHGLEAAVTALTGPSDWPQRGGPRSGLFSLDPLTFQCPHSAGRRQARCPRTKLLEGLLRPQGPTRGPSGHRTTSPSVQGALQTALRRASLPSLYPQF